VVVFVWIDESADIEKATPGWLALAESALVSCTGILLLLLLRRRGTRLLQPRRSRAFYASQARDVLMDEPCADLSCRCCCYCCCRLRAKARGRPEPPPSGPLVVA
jgi:hypothetical protein